MQSFLLQSRLMSFSQVHDQQSYESQVYYTLGVVYQQYTGRH